MNDYTMTFLATDRSRELQAEAGRARLARTARADEHRPRATRSRGPLRLGLDLLLRRVAA